MLLFLGVSSYYSSSPYSHTYQVSSSSSTLPSKPINITLTSTQILRVNTPVGSNVTLLSVRGGQYDIGLFSSGGKNALLFTPLQNSNYSLILNVSSIGQNYAQLAILGSPTNSWTKNISSTGNLIVDIVLSVVPPPATTQNSGWNPLFGFTGISLGGITIDATGVLIIFALFSVALIGLGMKYSQKMLYGESFSFLCSV